LLSKNLTIRIYKTIILPVVLYGCETWSLILREEHRLRVFENRVQRGILGPKIGEVRGEWRKLHNEELVQHKRLVTLQNFAGMQDSSRARCTQMEGHWKKEGRRRRHNEELHDM
jgi:hypothetical protein